MRRVGLLGVVVLFMSWFPLVAVAVLAGIAFGWRVPVAFAAWFGFLVALSKVYSPNAGKARATAELVGIAFVGVVVGGLLFGGLGAIAGVALGFTMRLGYVPVTRGRSFSFL